MRRVSIRDCPVTIGYMKLRFSREARTVFLLGIISTTLFTFQLGKESFWLDEIYSVRYATHFSTFLQAVANGASSERNMWLYYIVLYGWAHLGNSEFIIRLLSVIFGVLGVITMYFLGREVAGKKTGIIAGLLLTVNTFYLQYAQEARAYSLLMFLFCLSTLFMYRVGKKYSKGALLLFFLSTFAAIFTHIFSIFFILLECGYLMFALRKSRMRIFSILAIAIFDIVTLYLLIHNPGRQVGWIPKPQLVQFILTYIFFCSGFVSMLIYFFTIGYGFLQRYRDPFYWYLAIVSTLPIAAVFLFSLFVKPIFIYRYMIFALPAIVLMGAMVLAQLKKNVSLVVLSVLILFQVHALQVYFSTHSKEQWREVTAVLAQEARPDDIIIIFPSFLDGAYNYYEAAHPKLKDIRTVVAFPEDQYINTREKMDASFESVENIIPRAGGVWLVTRKENLPEIRDKQRKYLDEKLVRNFKKEPHRYSFYQLDLEYFAR